MDQDLKKKGYKIFKNFFNDDEINQAKQIAQKKYYNKKEKNYVDWDDPDLWELICNNKIINLLSKVFNGKFFYMHDSAVNIDNIGDNFTWHRDNPCRRIGIGPDWDTNFDYNVFTAIIYLEDTNETNTSLSVIPKSHKLEFKKSLNHILRFIHYKIKDIKILKLFKKLIEFFISKEIIYEAGDLVLFHCNLLHSGVCRKNGFSKRTALVIRYGGEGMHSENYINYELNHRHGKNKYNVCKNKEKFFLKLKENKIYISPNVQKKHIQGITIPRFEDQDVVIYGSELNK
tara:strand:- start:16581 stop:17441 length:861 start_codon:yes stop_codon:yes gene_type:complete